jgi:hypothetical protein
MLRLLAIAYVVLILTACDGSLSSDAITQSLTSSSAELGFPPSCPAGERLIFWTVPHALCRNCTVLLGKTGRLESQYAACSGDIARTTKIINPNYCVAQPPCLLNFTTEETVKFDQGNTEKTNERPPSLLPYCWELDQKTCYPRGSTQHCTDGIYIDYICNCTSSGKWQCPEVR